MLLDILQTIGICVSALALAVIAFALFMLWLAFAPIGQVYSSINQPDDDDDYDDDDDDDDVPASDPLIYYPRGRRKRGGSK